MRCAALQSELLAIVSESDLESVTVSHYDQLKASGTAQAIS